MARQVGPCVAESDVRRFDALSRDRERNGPMWADMHVQEAYPTTSCGQGTDLINTCDHDVVEGFLRRGRGQCSNIGVATRPVPANRLGERHPLWRRQLRCTPCQPTSNHVIIRRSCKYGRKADMQKAVAHTVGEPLQVRRDLDRCDQRVPRRRASTGSEQPAESRGIRHRPPPGPTLAMMSIAPDSSPAARCARRTLPLVVRGS